MFTIESDKTINVTRGDVLYFGTGAKDKETNEVYVFQPGDIVRMSVYGKKNCENVVLQKDFLVETPTTEVDIFLDKNDTKIGKTISKPTVYWYEIELNPDEKPQTIIGYDEEGAKIFRLYPEGEEIPEEDEEVNPADIPVIDDELDPLSNRPVRNKAIAKAVMSLDGALRKTNANADKLEGEISVERARITNLAQLEEGSTTGDAELQDIRVGADGKVYTNAGTAVREQAQTLDNTKQRRYGYFEAVEIPFTEEAVYQVATKTAQTQSGGVYSEYAITDEVMLLVSGFSWSSYVSFPLGAFYDKNGTMLKRIGYKESKAYTKELVNVPSGAAKLVINGNAWNYPAIEKFIPGDLENDISEIREMVTSPQNALKGKKVVWLGTSVSFGQNAETSYPYEAAQKLNFELVNCSVPGLATHTEADGTAKQYGSLVLSKQEYVEQGWEIPENPIEYTPGGSYNNYYRTFENVFCEANADADIFVFDIAPNNTNFDLSDWNLFDYKNWRYKDGSDFASHRSTFLGALLFLMDKMYELNENARMILILGSGFAYLEGKTAFQTVKDKWNMPIIDLWGKVNTSPKSLLKMFSKDGTDPHPSTLAHQIMGRMLTNDLLSVI
jgi:hypothetical protein